MNRTSETCRTPLNKQHTPNGERQERGKKEGEREAKRNIWSNMKKHLPTLKKLNELQKGKTWKFTLRHIKIKLWEDRISKSAREVSQHREVIHNNINSWFIIWNHETKRQWDYILKVLKGKDCQSRILWPNKTILQQWKRN